MASGPICSYGVAPVLAGLDHVCCQAASVAELNPWATHLGAESIGHCGVYAMQGVPIFVFTFNDPDGIQLATRAHGVRSVNLGAELPLRAGRGFAPVNEPPVPGAH